MYIPDVELHECTTLQDAVSCMRRWSPRARFIAGGTDLLVDLKTGRTQTTHLVSLRRIAALCGVSLTADGLRIGAMTTITELNASLLIRNGFAPLLDAAGRMAAPPIRNMATVGGNIMSAVPCADLPPILMAMHARVEVWSGDQARTAPLQAVLAGPRRTFLHEAEILTAVVVPAVPRGEGAAYERFGLRDGNAIPVAGAAASLRLDGRGIIQDARVVLGAVSPIPTVVTDAASMLTGRRADDEAFSEAAVFARNACRPISDVRGSAQFRRDLIEVLTRRALLKASERARRNTT